MGTDGTENGGRNWKGAERRGHGGNGKSIEKFANSIDKQAA